MIRLPPPPAGVVRLPVPRLPLESPQIPTPPRIIRPVLPVGSGMAVCEVAGMVRIDLVGDHYDGRTCSMLTPAQAMQLATELGIIARKIGL